MSILFPQNYNGLSDASLSIVFSTWRLTLDVIESGLNQHNIACVRFDGKVPQTRRQVVLNRFKTEPNVRVMLLTLSCGAVGLTLTEASRAYLMEPHWVCHPSPPTHQCLRRLGPGLSPPEQHRVPKFLAKHYSIYVRPN